MNELDNLYDWLYDLKNIRNSYGKTGIKQIYQSDLDLGMKLYLELKNKISSIKKGRKLYLDTKKMLDAMRAKYE